MTLPDGSSIHERNILEPWAKLIEFQTNPDKSWFFKILSNNKIVKVVRIDQHKSVTFEVLHIGDKASYKFIKTQVHTIFGSDKRGSRELVYEWPYSEQIQIIETLQSQPTLNYAWVTKEIA